jgi:hypothetical protein
MTELDPQRVVDAFFAGTVFLDVILSGLPGAPVSGQEIWATGRALSPGGIANNATGTARLGLRTGLAAASAMTSAATWPGGCWRPSRDLTCPGAGECRSWLPR